MTVQQLIDYLRLSVKVQDPDTTLDKRYLVLNDEGIRLYLEIAMQRDFPSVPSLEYLPANSVYAVILLAKKELYHALAVSRANDVDLIADENNSIKQSQRFDHYMKLIAQVDAEYNRYIADGGAGGNTLTSYDVLLSDRYATDRNYNKGVIPALTLYLRGVTANSIELAWTVVLDRFKNYKVFISDETILDPYTQGNKIKSTATLVTTIFDSRQTTCRIENLLPSHTYHVVVSASEQSGLTGYFEMTIATESE